MKIKFYSDPGHGWGAVKRKILDELGIADQITPFSYQKGQTVYLEEDCDLHTLVTKLALNGVTVEYEQRSTEGRSPIRSYDRFSAI